MPATFHDLKGKSVFISGGGSGIGASLTEGFVRQGAKVAFVQRADASAFCDEIEKKTGSRPLFIPCDVTDISALEKAIAQAKAAHGAIDVLVNNAAADTRHTLDGTSVEDWDRALNVNLRHYFFAMKAVAEDMKARRQGAIINFSSISYLMGNAGYPAYVAAKSGITGLTRAIARELGPYNIRVNALLPGWVMTERQLKLWVTEDAMEEHLSRQCLKEKIMPEDMIEPTLFLASDASRMMTGQALVVDGGVTVTG